MWRTISVCTVVCASSAMLAPSHAAAQYHHDHHGHSGSHSHTGVSVGVGPIVRYPFYRYAPYPLWGGGFGGGYSLPPLFMPADALYGPQAMLRFMGLGGNGILAPVANPLPNPRPAPLGGGFGMLAPNPNPVGQPAVRVSNEEAKGRAGRFLQLGNDHFHKQQFTTALGLYKQAITAAPDVAVNYFRQGLALIALGRYEQAAKTLKKGLSLDPDWPRSQFRLDDVYGDNRVVKAAHREALAQAATAQPDDSDLLFLLGVILYFDGQPDRARPFFQRAHELNVADRAHLVAFLKLMPAPPIVKADGVKL
jgi:tetratricopeptide (TPR) repeat protein